MIRIFIKPRLGHILKNLEFGELFAIKSEYEKDPIKCGIYMVVDPIEHNVPEDEKISVVNIKTGEMDRKSWRCKILPVNEPEIGGFF